MDVPTVPHQSIDEAGQPIVVNVTDMNTISSTRPYDAQTDAQLPHYLDFVKSFRVRDLPDIRYAKEIGGVMVDGIGRFSTDRASQAMFSGGLALLTMSDDAIPWKLEDGSFVQLTPEQFRQVAKEVGTHVLKCFANEARLAGVLQACTTLEEVWGVDFTSGW